MRFLFGRRRPHNGLARRRRARRRLCGWLVVRLLALLRGGKLLPLPEVRLLEQLQVRGRLLLLREHVVPVLLPAGVALPKCVRHRRKWGRVAHAILSLDDPLLPDAAGHAALDIQDGLRVAGLLLGLKPTAEQRHAVLAGLVSRSDERRLCVLEDGSPALGRLRALVLELREALPDLREDQRAVSKEEPWSRAGEEDGP
jgi:hypothetical protein